MSMSNPLITKRPMAEYFFTNDLNARTDFKGSVHRAPLICIGEVRKSGAKVYFCPANNDFCTIQDDTVSHFQTANEAYKSQDW